jgi:hypothetical protein
MTREELLADAVQVLTRAAREAGDFADFLAAAAAGAAANVGGTETLLSGRPGSWEADFTRQLVAGTVGWDGEYLLEHRTEPVRVEVWPEEILSDLGAEAEFDAARDEINRRVDALEDLDGDDAPEHEALAVLEYRLEELWSADVHAYGVALRAAVEEAAAALEGLRVPVEVSLKEGWRPYGHEELTDALELRLLEQAVDAVTWVPGGGRAPLERLED